MNIPDELKRFDPKGPGEEGEDEGAGGDGADAPGGEGDGVEQEEAQNKVMENLASQVNENSQLAKFDPAITYAGASALQLTETEMKALSAPFKDLDYEITPDGFIYLPQVLSLQRLNTAIGVGRWSLLLINPGKELVKDGLFKVFYDGALIIRNCFVARSCGEASYSLKNGKQSFATALESAKSDCRGRCLKDLGVGSDAWNPTFIRRWQKEHAIRVIVDDNGNRKVIWRRKDLDPFPNEIGLAPTKPTVPQQVRTGAPADSNELPWLNEGTPEYDNALTGL
ncbi:unnamed protein product, partial [Rotaria sp. Silwood2]